MAPKALTGCSGEFSVERCNTARQEQGRISRRIGNHQRLSKSQQGIGLRISKSKRLLLISSVTSSSEVLP
jgi:hypothetical protein